MSLQRLRAYIAYRCKARHRNGHGIHSPFMYELVRTVLFAKKTVNEPRNKQERIRLRLEDFCEKKNLKMVLIKERSDLLFYNENCIALLAQPHANTELWHLLSANENTQVTADCWQFGLALAIPHLQKQSYVIRV